MPTRYSKYISTFHLIGDIILLNISFFLAFIFLYEYQIVFYGSEKFLTYFLLFNLSWISLSYILRTYSINRVEEFETILINLLKLFSLHFLIITSILFLGNIEFERSHLFYTYIILIILIISWRVGLVQFFKFYRKLGYNYRNVIILGYNEFSKELQQFFLRYPHYGYRFLGFFDDIPHKTVKGKLNEVNEFALKNEVDEIYYSLSEVNYEYLNNLVDFADNNFIRVKIITDFKILPYKNFKIEFFDNLPILEIRSIPLDDPLNRILKRSFDLAFSFIVTVVVLSWLIPIIGALIKIDSKGPVFFRQKRSGKNNVDFFCYKFRTMYVNKDSDSKQASKNDNRITRIGKFLRRSNIDELPQFFNVLIGNMSIVGPRPHMLKHTEEYSQIIEKYMVRHFVKPGITGLAQIKGYRGETKDPILMKNRTKIDRFYIENWSFVFDIKIIFITVLNMIRGDKNAY